MANNISKKKLLSIEDIVAGKDDNTPVSVSIENEVDILNIEINEIISSLNLTTDELSQIKAHFKRVTLDPYIMHIIPRCNEATCLFERDDCPFVKMGKIPANKPCPIAMGLAMSLRDKWIQAIASRLQPKLGDATDEENSVQYDIVIYRLIVSLVEVDLRDILLDKHISLNGLIDYNANAIVGKAQGEIYWLPGESIASIIHEKIQTRRDTILKQLLLTPEISAKYKMLADEEKRKTKSIDDLKDLIYTRNSQLKNEMLQLNQNKTTHTTTSESPTLYDRLNIDKDDLEDK